MKRTLGYQKMTFWSKNSMTPILGHLGEFVWQPSICWIFELQGCSILEGGVMSGDDQFSITEPPQDTKTNTELKRGTRASIRLHSLKALLTLLGPRMTSVTHHTLFRSHDLVEHQLRDMLRDRV